MFTDYLATIATEEALTETEYQNTDVKNNDVVIAVMDRGWVFVGVLTKLDKNRIRLDNCYNIHSWGTSEGLGELAIKGPLENTVLNKTGPVFGEPIFLMKVENLNNWK